MKILYKHFCSHLLLPYLFALLASAAQMQAADLFPAGEEAVDSRDVYYFGNSLTACTDPKWHGELGASAGKEWNAVANLGAGWPLWKHRESLRDSGVNLSRDSQGDLTIDPASIQDPSYNLRKFFNSKFDALVLQPFETPLVRVTDQPFADVKFDEPQDVGDIASAIDLIDSYLALNPGGDVFIYQNWPDIQFKHNMQLPPEEEWPQWAKDYKQRRGKAPSAAEFAYLVPFDYEAEWLGKTYVNDNPDQFWRENNRCQDFHNQLFEALKAHYPKLWAEGRLNIIPAGDIFMELHRLAQAGQLPGITDIREFYTDAQHIRGGLPRYTAAASFFTALFRDDPAKLDYTLYSSEERYRADKHFGDDPHHDRGELMVITPELAETVNRVVLEVISNHLYTKR